MPLHRRDFLRSVAVVAAAGAVGAPRLAGAAERYDRRVPEGWDYPVAEELLPFGHGVASGDPLADRVILWTRITIPDPRGWDSRVVTDPQGIRVVPVRWVLARDPGLTDVVRRGTVTTDASRDWTVKVDADRLPSATTLYYAFEALGYRSPVGRTRTAPAPGDDVTELTIAHVACTSWWQDVFNAYARIGERDDLDLVTHAGDHIYDSSGGHPASRYHAGQRSWNGDLDNRKWRDRAECRRRYALYYADPNLLRAHLAAPFAVMADQHDYASYSIDGEVTLSTEQAGEVFFEWTPLRPPIPDGSGAFPASPGPNVNVAVPHGRDALHCYRSLPYGDLAEVILIDIRRFARREGEENRMLGDAQWAWLQQVLLESKARGVTHRAIVNQINLSQLRAFNVPFASAFERAFGMDPNAPQGELYTSGWGTEPAERTRLYRFLRQHGIVDNVVMSGDSHGFFASDLTEDPMPPAYAPGTSAGTLPVVGVEVVPSTMGRPGGQDVIAEELYFAASGGGRGAAYTDAATFDAVYRPAALGPISTLERAAQAANPNLRYFNWRAEYGHAMVHLRPDRSIIECWTSPQRVPADTARLLVQLESRVGAPGLRIVPLPRPVRGARRDAPAPG
jgi:alkaline phosphatase D